MATAEKTFTLTEAQLKRLIAEATATSGPGLPPGAYRSETGETFHDIWEPTGRVRTNKATGRREAVNRKVTRPITLVSDPSPAGLRATRRACMLSGADWYHPTLGWHLYGSKRQTDVEANLGDGAALFEMEFTELPDEDDYGSTTATMQGVEKPEPPPEEDEDEDEDEDSPVLPDTTTPTSEPARVPVGSGKKAS